MPTLTPACRVGTQERWRVLRFFVDYVLAAFGLRMVRAVRWQLTSFRIGRRGTDAEIFWMWGGWLVWYALLRCWGPPFLGFGSAHDFRGARGAVINAWGGPCAASFDALLATRAWLLCMARVGTLLLAVCWASFPYWHDLLTDKVARLEQSALSSSDAATIRRRFARGRKVMLVSYAMGITAMLGQNLLVPLFPGLALSEALFTYRCIDPRAGQTDMIVDSVFAFAGLQALIMVNWVASKSVCLEWEDREWERAASGRSSYRHLL